MISIFAWRNLWRNKLRSIVIITAITLGIFAGIFMIAFTNGMVNDRIKSIIGIEIVHVQIHQTGFLDNDQFSLLINNADSIVQSIKTQSSVVAVCKRLIINAMVATAETGLGVRISGVDFNDECKVTQLSTKIIAGKYLDVSGKNSIVISDRLAKKLKVGLKNKIIITVQDVNKNIIGGAFRVVGIYQTDNMMFDDTNVFVRNNDLSLLTGLNGTEAHEIAILLNQNYDSELFARDLSMKFPNLDVQDWQKLSPEAGYLVSAMTQYLYIFMIIILMALCFGIINTMLMVIMERVKELGMLMAIGMNRFRVFLMIMLETVFLSITGGFIGLLIGFVASKYFEHVGIDLYFWKDAFAEIGYSSIVYPFIDMASMVFTAIMIVITGIVSAIYPAYKALKLNPSEAIRS